MNKVTNRIVQNWKTTLLGVMVALLSLALVYFEKATLTEVALILPFVITLIWAKDTILKP
jgi:hypothetical protein